MHNTLLLSEIVGAILCLRGVPKSVLRFFSSRRRHTRCLSDWSSDVCSSDLQWRLLRGGSFFLLDCVDQRAVLCYRQRIHAHFLGFAVDGQLEAAGQQGAKHQPHLVASGGSLRLGVNVVFFRIEPGWAAGDLIVGHVVSLKNELLEGYPSRAHSAWVGGDPTFAAPRSHGIAGFDGGYFECGRSQRRGLGLRLCAGRNGGKESCGKEKAA